MSTILTSVTPMGGASRNKESTVFVGSLIPALIETAPDGYLLCNGQAVSRTTYSALFAEIGTTFGEGDGSTTFNLPDLRSRFIKGKEDSETLGQLNEAGLPNISGNFSPMAWSGYTHPSGAFVDGGTSTSYNADGNWDRGVSLNFDASRSSSIYGKSSTVTPKNISVNWFIKY